VTKPASDLTNYKWSPAVSRTVEIDDPDKCATYIRYTVRGLVLVRSYYEGNESLVQAIIGRREYQRWYEPGAFTTRSAALLVTRFFRDIDAQSKEVQP